ncbi:MAG: DEAD/DEAH box helicase [Pseudomonadales bacterium]|nr:DEAD/DEAH box helicase [Pseudomonadales bacterium]
MRMAAALDEALAEGGYTIVEEFLLSGRAPTHVPIPRFLFDSRVGIYLNHVTNRAGPWRHQAAALEAFGAGNNVVVSTGTASGKSLIFQGAAFHQLLLDPRAKAVVFYPLKALAADQYLSWNKAAAAMELPKTFVGRIDGSVPTKEREAILASSRVLLMTPDVFHAWLMSRLASPEIKEFLRELKLIVLDEAHTLEGVFGSNFAFLFRRLVAARNAVIPVAERQEQLRAIAATATISEAAGHLSALTGMEFQEVDASMDGSPQADRRCVHLAAPAGKEMAMAGDLQARLLKSASQGGFVTFVDSRKAVEMLAMASNKGALRDLVGNPAVLPYRAGYDAEDRQAIESRLKSGELKGVVSTSALELGIDIPHLQVGINIGAPLTRKNYRQRLGRVGRRDSGAFVIIGEPNAFTRYGTSFRQYHDLSVEPSYLYLDNRFMQYAHARCLVDELEAAGSKDRSELPTRVKWPDGFGAVFESARPGNDRPREFDAIAMLGGDVPQLNYPLRNVGEVNFAIAQGDQVEAMGDASLSQAIRECYPGATYFHMGRPYKVQSWVTSGFRPQIKVKYAPGAIATRPRVSTWINAGLTGSDVINGHFRTSALGLLTECQMLITERVEGYAEGDGEYRPYNELQQKNPSLRPRMRQFRTTGVLLAVDATWFREAANKRFFAERLTEIFCREYSVLPQDVGSASTNVAVNTVDGHKPRSDCIVLFDQTYGSLRLTERVYSEFKHLLRRMEVAVDSERGGDAAYYGDFLTKLGEFYDSLKSLDPFDLSSTAEEPRGIIRVFSPGSTVGYREEGVLFTAVEVVAPTIMPADRELWYQVRCPPKGPGAAPAKRWINSQFLEPSADHGEWSYSLWNPDTDEYVERD